MRILGRRLGGALDRYVFGEFVKIFVVTALGFPILVFVIDVVENLNKYLSRHLTLKAVALSYVYWLPDTMFNVLPAAVLFATVFTVGAVTRHSEITAAKASGISFYRFISTGSSSPSSTGPPSPRGSGWGSGSSRRGGTRRGSSSFRRRRTPAAPSARTSRTRPRGGACTRRRSSTSTRRR
jgi:hypothetical protein